MQLFHNDLETTLVDRPNRYIVRVSTESGIVEAHCPNPGRMTEILFPGTPIILERAIDKVGTRKTAWTAVAAVYRDQVVPLASHRANNIARELILPRVFPDAERITPEQRLGSGRVDFVIEEPNIRTYVEVKSCTLVEHGVAMFPDAPSDRATRHVKELENATLSPAQPELESRGLILFVITHGDPEVFTPNVHTDPVFARTLREVIVGTDGRVEARAAYVTCSRDGAVRLINTDIEIDLRPVDLADADSGGYLLVIQVDKPTNLQFGKNNSAALRGGFYVYVGSAMRGLSARLARHRRGQKKHHWHVDDLLDVGSLREAYPILSCDRNEHALARDITAIANGSVPGFGATDSPLPSHLLFFEDDPRERRDFVGVLFMHRHLDVFKLS